MASGAETGYKPLISIRAEKMMNINDILSRSTAILLLSFILGACASSSDPAPVVDGNSGVSLTFTVASDIDGSRAGDLCDGDEAASAWENHIILGKSTILVFKHDGTLLKSATGNDLEDVIVSADKSTLTATIKIDDPYLLNLKQAVVDIAIVANVDFTKQLTPGITTIDDIADMITQFTVPTVNDDNSGIPMWGYRGTVYLGYLAGDGSKASPLQCGTINMLRAWAKINVLTGSLPTGYRVTTTTFNTPNESFYTAPYDVLKIYARNTENITAPCPTNPSESLTTFNSATTSEGVVTFYAPETGNSDDDHYIQLSLQAPDGTVVEDKQNIRIPVCLYDEAGKPKPNSKLDLIRNHIYSFELQYDANAEITLKVRVKKWGYHKIVFDM